jgi:hypothetical protein
MTLPNVPYSLPRKFEPKLTRVLAYWESLKRGGNNIPFWDDVKTTSLPDLADSLLLIDVFAKPERFRLAIVGRQLTEQYGESVTGTFVDEMEVKSPFEFLLSQCSATVESGAPTFYRHESIHSDNVGAQKSYSRLLLPAWGDGHIRLLLGALMLHRAVPS